VRRLGGDWIPKTKLNVSKGMEKIMVLKREEIKEIIKKMEEFYKKWERALNGEIRILMPMRAGGGGGPVYSGVNRRDIVNPGTIQNPENEVKK
jgi:hypothetical protein